jgi:hypothetical protein
VPRRGVWESPHLSEALAEFGNEQLRLLKRGEVTTFRNLVPVEELRIGLSPHIFGGVKKSPLKMLTATGRSMGIRAKSFAKLSK